MSFHLAAAQLGAEKCVLLTVYFLSYFIKRLWAPLRNRRGKRCSHPSMHRGSSLTRDILMAESSHLSQTPLRPKWDEPKERSPRGSPLSSQRTLSPSRSSGTQGFPWALQALRIWLAVKTRCAEDKVLPLVTTVLPPGNKHNSSSLTGIRALPLMSGA